MSPDAQHGIVRDLLPLATPIESLLDDPANARRHPKRNLESIKGSLAAYGQRKPVVVRKSTGVIEAGNGTRAAAVALGWTHLAAVFVDDDPATAIGFSIADNRTAELAEWDDDELAKLLGSVEGQLGEDELGFTDAEIAALLAGVEDPDNVDEGEPVEVVPEPPTKAVSREGEVYELGPHRLICGSCAEPLDWLSLLGSTKANVAVTSPPYASQRKYDEGSEFKPIKPEDYVAWWEPIQANIAAALAPGGSFFLNIKPHGFEKSMSLYVIDLVAAHVRSWGWNFVEEFVFTHHGTPLKPQWRFKNGFEPIYQFSRQRDFSFYPDSVKQPGSQASGIVKGCNAKLQGHSTFDGNKQGEAGFCADIKRFVELSDDGMAYPSNVLSVGRNREALGHSAAFAVRLPEFFLKAYSQKGEVVLDPFMGSGSTLIAAAKTDRVGYGFEISPVYCDVIRKRWGNWARANKVEPGSGAL